MILSQVEERHESLPGSVLVQDSGPDQKEWEADRLLHQHYDTQFDPSFAKHSINIPRQLDDNRQRADMRIGDDRRERETLAKINEVIGRIAQFDNDPDGVDWCSR